jgi:hypothetical protein
MRLLRGTPLVLSLSLLPGLSSAQQQNPDPSDIVNGLLSGLSGFQQVTGEELEKEVAEVGGIPFRRDVTLDYMTKEELSRYLSELMDEEYPPARAEADARTLTAFDLLDGRTNLRELRKRLLLENVAGFYDERPGKKRLYAVSSDRRLTPSNQLILSHELRHALQDQYTNIHDALPDSVGDFDDRRLALLSLLEGDATLVMEKFLLHKMGGGLEDSGLGLGGMPTPPVEGAPPVLADEMVLPYIRGLEFVQAIYQKGGWSAVQAAWNHPPESTDQVLHPEHFLEHRHPRSVDLPSPSGGRLLSDGVLGEMLLMTLLGPDGPPVSGWMGDHYRSYDLSGKTLLVWKSSWDSPGATAAFREALQGRFEKSHGKGQPDGAAVIYRKGGWTVGVGGHDGVTLLTSDDPTAFVLMLNVFR